jgi:hypothetical protein
MATADCDALRERWIAMIDRIHDELTDLLWQREQIRMIGKMIDDNSQLQQNDKPFLWSARRWYMVFAAMAVRRQTDLNEKAVSLKKVLSEIRDNPACITRQVLVDHFRAVYPRADEVFENTIVDGVWNNWCDAYGRLNSERIVADLDKLDQESKSVLAFASSTLAHTSKKAIGKDFNLTFNDLDAVIDHLARLAIAYGSLLTGRSSSTLLPTAQFDWYAQFRFPWKPAQQK